MSRPFSYQTYPLYTTPNANIEAELRLPTGNELGVWISCVIFGLIECRIILRADFEIDRLFGTNDGSKLPVPVGPKKIWGVVFFSGASL